MAELLMLCEEDDFKRATIETLRKLDPPSEPHARRGD
jgi:hypothetical protein